jgi:hypothetical protein
MYFCATRYFSEKVSPGVHDSAARKEAFGAWKTQFIQLEHELEATRRRLRHQQEEQARKKVRSDMLIKYSIAQNKRGPGDPKS